MVKHAKTSYFGIIICLCALPCYFAYIVFFSHLKEGNHDAMWYDICIYVWYLVIKSHICSFIVNATH